MRPFDSFLFNEEEKKLIRTPLKYHWERIDQNITKILLKRLFYSIEKNLHIASIHDKAEDEIKYIFRKFMINAKQCDKRHNQFIPQTLCSLSLTPQKLKFANLTTEVQMC